MIWTTHDTWIVVTGAIVAAACALPGCFLVLRKQSMMGDAISHAVLPGLALAYMVTHSRASFAMFAGAAIVGLLTAFFTEAVHRIGKVEQNASMGVVFTSLFALGLVLIERSASHVDLDTNCVLYGALELVALEPVRIGAWEVPLAALSGAIVLLLNGLFVCVCYKELRIATFDPDLATTMGINATLLHYLLMTLVAVTVVACFEAVGSILVIAMLVVPAACAQLLTHRLATMLLLSVLIGCASALVGHLAAVMVPHAFGAPSTSSQGMMAVAAGLILLGCVVLAPQQGLLSRAWQRVRLARRIAAEDILGIMYRLESPVARGASVTLPDMSNILQMSGGVGPLGFRLALRELIRAGKLEPEGGNFRLTERGRSQAANIIRSHRLWEVYLSRHLGLPLHELHFAAEQLEHVTTPAMQDQLAGLAQAEAEDPHGREIPGRH